MKARRKRTNPALVSQEDIIKDLNRVYQECGKIVSFSDPRFHKGTLYKAANFVKINTKKYKDYIYIDKNGREYHKSKMRVPAGVNELEYAQSQGFQRLEVPQKERWEYDVR